MKILNACCFKYLFRRKRALGIDYVYFKNVNFIDFQYIH